MDRIAFLLRELKNNPALTQREVADAMQLSLGTVNTLFRDCTARGFIEKPASSPRRRLLTEEGSRYLNNYRMDGAVILAAGFGSRFVPLTYETPKGLLDVLGERMIERQIKQLQEAGIRDITVVVGYLKEKFEYLRDRFQVKLLYNPDYAEMNNISSVYHAASLFRGRNVYLLSSDNWLRSNPFHAYESCSWYSSVHMEGNTKEWVLKTTRNGLIKGVTVGGTDADVMYGPVCLLKDFSEVLLPALEEAYHTPGKEQYYWENVYVDLLNAAGKGGKSFTGSGISRFPVMYKNLRPSDEVYEFENLEELRAFDKSYRDHSGNQAMELISNVFRVPESEITGIRILKAGMTNHSFLFQVEGQSYICRIPGEGTEQLINRREEADVYRTIRLLKISEEILFFVPTKGYKISRYYENSRTADLTVPTDINRCMGLLRQLHSSGLTVPPFFDIRARIGFYENLCRESGGIPFEDYGEIRERMERLLSWLDGLNRPKALSHVDSVATNFLFTEEGDVKLIDWEYAGMADPLIDIAMCAIYSYFTKEASDDLLERYLGRPAEKAESLVVYAYMALGGFLWALWAVYKENIGIPFGEYTLIMYRYAKDYGSRVLSDLEK